MAWSSGLQLRVVSGNDEGRVIPLNSPDITLGRAAEATENSPSWILFSEPTVSRIHALMQWSDEAQCYILHHRSRTNPTLVDGNPISEHPLHLGERVGLGLLEFQLEPIEIRAGKLGDAVQAPRSSISAPVIDALSSLAEDRSRENMAGIADLVDAGMNNQEPEHMLHMLVAQGPDQGQSFALKEPVLVIGRIQGPGDPRTNAGILLHDVSVPTEQALLVWQDRAATYGILQSDNSNVPTRIRRIINGVPKEIIVRSDVPTVLNERDVIMIGRSALVLRQGVNEAPRSRNERSRMPQRGPVNPPPAPRRQQREPARPPMPPAPARSPLRSWRSSNGDAEPNEGYADPGYGQQPAPYRGYGREQEGSDYDYPEAPYNAPRREAYPPAGRRQSKYRDGYGREENYYPDYDNQYRPQGREAPPYPDEEYGYDDRYPEDDGRYQRQQRSYRGYGPEEEPPARPGYGNSSDNAPAYGYGAPRGGRPGQNAALPRGGAPRNSQDDGYGQRGPGSPGRQSYADYSRRQPNAERIRGESHRVARPANGPEEPTYSNDPRRDLRSRWTPQGRGPAPYQPQDEPHEQYPEADAPEEYDQPSIRVARDQTNQAPQPGQYPQESNQEPEPEYDYPEDAEEEVDAQLLSVSEGVDGSSTSIDNVAEDGQPGADIRPCSTPPHLAKKANSSDAEQDEQIFDEDIPQSQSVAQRGSRGVAILESRDQFPRMGEPPKEKASEKSSSKSSKDSSWNYRSDYVIAYESGYRKGLKVALLASELTDDRAITLGSPGPRQNDIEVDEDCVANDHAILRYRNGRFTLMNFRSDIFVNKQVVGEGEQAVLMTGDIIQLGNTTLVYSERKTVETLNSWNLTVLEGVDSDQNKTFALKRERITIGRDRTNDVRLTDPEISRVQCTLVLRGDSFFVQHRSGTNETYVNGLSVQPGAEKAVEAGDQIKVSSRTILALRRL